MSLGCRSLKVFVTHNFLLLQKAFILCVMTQINITLGCLNKGQTAYSTKLNCFDLRDKRYRVRSYLHDGRKISVRTRSKRFEQIDIQRLTCACTPVHARTQPSKQAHTHACTHTRLQCPLCAILSLHIRQPTHSSACAQICYCHHWLAL